MKEQLMFVITADVIKSKSHNEIESDLRKRLLVVNAKFKDILYTKFVSLKGDEFQALIERENYAYILQVIRFLKSSMGRYKLRIGVGYGSVNKIESNIDMFGSWDFNGEAFFRARDAIDGLKEKKNSSVQMRTYFNIASNKLINESVNLLYYNIDEVMSKWDEDGWEIIKLLEKDFTHERITKMMNKKNNTDKNRDTYTKKIQRLDWYLVKETEDLINNILMEEVI